ncbi:hypothetical protein SporoP32a_10290 [Sporosarcina ureae]|nr:hypothetical protein SporoP32a_10290 [Sporosarcina ureae]
MKKKIILIFSTIVLVIGITLFLMLIIPTEDIPADYVFEMEYKIADFSNGIQEQKKSLNNVDLNDRDSIVLNLYKFSVLTRTW